MTNMPSWLGSALSNGLDRVSRKELTARAQVISDTYRACGNSDVIRTDADALAYAVVRMPATFSAVRNALGHTAEQRPDLMPKSLLDVGAGPGTASWAGCDTWPSIEQATLLDRNPRLLDLARKFRATPDGPGVDAAFVTGTIPAALKDAPVADLVLASYALTEIEPTALPPILAELWRLAAMMLVIVEPGTPDGFQRLLVYRDLLVSAGGYIAAPCTHGQTCPLSASARWCHFSQRLPRSRDHLIVKSASMSFEDEKFCYIAVTKTAPETLPPPRILATPRVGKGGVALTLCAPDAVEERVVERRQKDLYKAASRYKWGDALDI